MDPEALCYATKALTAGAKTEAVKEQLEDLGIHVDSRFLYNTKNAQLGK